LRYLEDIDQVTHAELSFLKQVQDAKSRAVREGPEHHVDSTL
jgi:hypothetical protein